MRAGLALLAVSAIARPMRWIVPFFLLFVCACASRDGGRGGNQAGADGGLDSGLGETDGSTADGRVNTNDSPWVDPACTDGQYSEPLPNAAADIRDLLGSYEPANVAAFLVSALERRYPVGAELTEKGMQATWFANQYGTNCLDYFLGGQNATPDQAFGRLGTIVHECGHVYDIERGMSIAGDHYQITETLSFQCSDGDSVPRGGKTFARSMLMGDTYAELRPACGGSPAQGCDSYADIYLTGDGGLQGFSVLFEEVVQYVNSLATAYAFLDQSNPQFRTSARDGILTFLWYVERYLKLAREDFPDAYAALVDDACWRDVILTTWGRAWLYLEATKDEPNLSIDGPALEALVLDTDLLSEIERLRSASGCN